MTVICCTEIVQLLCKLEFLGQKGGAGAKVAFTMPTTVLSPLLCEAWIQVYPLPALDQSPEQGEC